MSSYEIIHDVSEELRVRLYDALATTPGLDLGLTSPQENISLVAPGEDGGPDVRVRAYLYHVDVSRHLRNQLPFSAPAQPQSQHQPPLPLQLRYLLTPVQDDEPTNHRMLGRLLQYFNDHPTVTTVLGEGLEGDPGRFPTALRLHIDTLSV
ncbi:MAG: Pvc16 family protein, partial [Pseudomonadota bacterium]